VLCKLDVEQRIQHMGKNHKNKQLRVDEPIDAKKAKVPEMFAARFVDIVRLVDAFCDAHLNDEYKGLCRKLAVAICRSGSAIDKGKIEGWAAGVVCAIGRVNFLTDPSQKPHMKSEQIAKGFGISAQTMADKARAIGDSLDLVPFHPDWSLPSKIDENPMVWFLQVNGMIMDIRRAPRGAQVAAYKKGLIPYIPADREPSRGNAKSARGTEQLFELEVALIDGPITNAFAKKNPSVVRTVAIRGSQTLKDLHDAIFEAFDRFDQHMYEFQVGGKRPMDPKARRYVLPGAMGAQSFDDEKPAGDVTRTTINSLGLDVDEPFGYWFDFGDDWWHQVTVNAIHDEVPPGRYPKVTNRIGESPPQYIDPDEDGEDEVDNEATEKRLDRVRPLKPNNHPS